MTAVSGLELADAATRAGIGGSFPVHNADSPAEVADWLRRSDENPGPVIPNLVVHRSNARLSDDLSVLTTHQVPAVITSVGSPHAVVGPLHDSGVLVLSDVGSLRHAERAVAAGADGLVLLTAGAGGQTGWANPLAFAHAVRQIWGGPMVLAGGIADGRSVLAALVAGFDLVYMGTPFIATTESAAPQGWKEAVVRASIDDIELTSAFTGLPTSMIRAPRETSWETPAGQFDLSRLDSTGLSDADSGARYSAGHSATGVQEVLTVAALVDKVEREFLDAKAELAQQLSVGS